MGSNQGVVWNDSDFPIQYCIYGAFQEMGSARTKRTINPRIDINVTEGAVNLDGFQSIRQWKINPKYAQSFVQVQPGRHSSVGLTQLRLNEHKISIRVEIGQYVKYLVKDVVIKSIKDFRLKIRYDLSIKTLGEDQTEDLIESNEDRSELRKEKEMRQEKIYAQTLKQLVSVVQ